jgi:hypothetical protein
MSPATTALVGAAALVQPSEVQREGGLQLLELQSGRAPASPEYPSTSLAR